jgi:hypothetical protein
VSLVALSLGQWESIATIVTAGLSIIVFVSVYLAWRTYKSQVRDNQIALLTGMGKYVNEVALVFVDHPEMRKYFHDGEKPTEKDLAGAEAIALALANALDHVLVHLGGIDGAEEETAAWHAYCESLNKNSPVMTELLSKNPSWYCKPLREQFGV